MKTAQRSSMMYAIPSFLAVAHADEQKIISFEIPAAIVSQVLEAYKTASGKELDIATSAEPHLRIAENGFLIFG